ncbi:MAG: ABC transporter ATP-binding protein [Proteobacteria bacterium]|nr:ABC transporter ATP-binding protein [Pseudomonadota bacterium]
MSHPSGNLDKSVISVVNVGKSYSRSGQKLSVLANLNFEAGAAQTIAITGPSGSGKSTLLGLLAGLDEPETGTIRMDGVDLTNMSQAGLASFRAKTVGIVFQQFHLLQTLTALENVSLPLEIAGTKTAEVEALSRLEAVGLGSRASHLPSQLSGGECQRVAIARALVVRPKILLADEPSGNLDAKTGEHVTDLLFDLVRKDGTTLILVTHNEELAKRCDYRYQLRDGQLHRVL